MFLINSRSYRFSATSISSGREALHQRRHTFFRSYGVNLPSSLTRVLSSALGFSPCPPVSVWGTVVRNLKLRGFSWKRGINHFSRARRHAIVVTPRLSRTDLPMQHVYTLEPGQPTPGRSSLLRPPIAVTRGTGILTCFPSTTAFALALGADSPCAD